MVWFLLLWYENLIDDVNDAVVSDYVCFDYSRVVYFDSFRSVNLDFLTLNGLCALKFHNVYRARSG